MNKKYYKWGALLILGGLLVLYVYLKDASKGPILPCIFYEVTGFYCPGCGMTRSVNAMMHLDFYQAFRYNLLPFIFSPIALVAYIKYKKKKPYENWILFMLGLAILYMIFRNIPYFNFLTPISL